MAVAIGVTLWLADNAVHYITSGHIDHEFSVYDRHMWAELSVFLVLGLALHIGRMRFQRQRDQLFTLSSAVEQSASMVVITDLEGNIEYVNPAFTAVTGYSPEEVYGKNPRILKSGETPREEYERLWNTITRGNTWRGQFHNRRKDGQLYWELAAIAPIKNTDEVITHFLASKQDITARKEAEQAEREQRILAETLRDTAAALNATLDLDDLLDRILVSISPLFSHDGAEISLIDGERVRVARLCRHVPERYRDQMTALTFKIDDFPLVRRMVNTRQPIWIVNTATDPAWTHHPATEWIRAFVSAPICRDDQIYGFITFHSMTPGTYNERDARRLQVFTDQAATAIHNAYLFAAECEQRVLAQVLHDTAVMLNSTLNIEAILDHILANVGQIVAHDAANVMLVEGDTARVVRGRGYEKVGLYDDLLDFRFKVNETPGIMHMIETRQPLIVNDTATFEGWVSVGDKPWARSYLAAPINVQNRLIGIIGLQCDQPGAFNQSDAHYLQAFADQAAIAMHNARLHAQLHDHAAGLEERVAERTEALEQQRAQLAAILDAMGEGVAYIEDRRVHFVNRALTHMLGYGSNELQGDEEQFAKLTPLDDDAIAELLNSAAAHIARDQVWRVHLPLIHKQEGAFEAALTVARVDRPNGQRPGSVIVIRDVSQEQVLQEQKDRFLTHAAHELRTPLSNMKMRLYLLQNQPERLEHHLQVMNDVTTNMEGLLEDLFDVVRLSRHDAAIHTEVFDLRQVVKDAVVRQQSAASQKQITLVCTLPDEPLPIFADPVRINQAVARLLANGIYQSPEGTQVAITAGLTDKPNPRISLTVQDSSPGIEPDLIPHIFDPFFRASEAEARGMGLGLTLARQIINLHRGELTVESEPGHGMTFHIRLPLYAVSDVIADTVADTLPNAGADVVSPYFCANSA